MNTEEETQNASADTEPQAEPDTVAQPGEGEQFSDPFGAVEKAIAEKKYGVAESLLGKIEERGAEWHYESAVLYKAKGWYLEALHSINKAIALEPENKKYAKEHEELERMRQKGKKRRKEKAPKNMGSTEGALAECCAMVGCEVCCTFACEGICEGC